MRAPLAFRLLPLSIGFALHAAAAAPPAPAGSPSTDAPACPIGVYRCPKKADDFSLCKPSALLEFYEPGLPTTGDREAAPADMQADRFDSSDSKKYVLTGHARLQRVDQLLQGDRLSYDSESTAYTAEGHVRYQDRGLLLAADKAQGTTTPNASTLDQVRYQVLSSRGNGTADRARLLDADHAALDRVSYSTCDIDDRRWELRARDMSLDQDQGVGRARDVTMRWGDVPFLWLPYARFPIDDRRQSGFLYPSLGSSNNGGFDMTLPYYLNLAPNFDATLYPRLIWDRGLMLGGEFRYLTDTQRGKVEFTSLPHDRAANRERGYFHFENYGVLSSHWGVSVNLNDVSDDRYFEDFGNTLTTVATSLLPSSAYLNGRGSWWSASIGGDRYQITDPSLSDLSEPYQRLPRATFEGEHDLAGPLRVGLDGEFVAFHKSCTREGGSRVCPTNGQRLDLYPYLALPLEGASWFLRPELGVRSTRYDLDPGNDAIAGSLSDTSPQRTVPIASVDAGLVFERDARLFGEDMLQTLEPRLYYLRVPYRDQSDLPVFDTQPISFDFGQLFRTNRYTGADRQTDANNLTLALTSRLLESDSGVERVAASLGQIRYFDDQRVQLPGQPPTDYAGSDYVGQLDLRLSERWRLSLAEQWDPNRDRSDLGTFSLQHRFGREGVLNLSYRYRRDFLEQADIAALVPLNERWRLVGRWNYSLRDDKTLEGFFGVEHDDCCTAWRILARHYVHNVAGDSTNALYFELEFKGIGALGQKTDDFLRRAILGYR
ncbi:MAG TPA: LPS assembly protein LptD [Rhodanobacteraceae bacterium]|nr:LPS assembly protein LptD [Rhodanobacteraceae bacterium]